MKEFFVPHKDNDQPKYLQIAEGIKDLIRKKILKKGEKLPSSRNLSQQFVCHRQTVTLAFDELISGGWIYSEPRKGYFVNEVLPDELIPETVASVEEQHTFWSKQEFYSKVELPSFHPETPIQYNFTSIVDDLRQFPIAEFRNCFNDSIMLASKQLLDYNSPQGWPFLVDMLTLYLRRFRAIKDRMVIVSNGSQEAIYYLMRMLLKPGDDVAIEAISYPPMFGLFKLLNSNVNLIQCDEQGIDPNHLENVLKTKKIKVLFLTPLHQFPTTITLSSQRREAIKALASKYEFLILEDDYDHECSYFDKPPAPMASDDPEGRVLYVSTFSKVMFPSARLGFMAIPQKLGQEICQYKRIVNHQNSAIIQDATARWMQKGHFERHKNKLRKRCLSRLETVISELDSMNTNGSNLKWVKPNGGMGLWLNTGQDTDQLSKKALAQGVFVTPESYYRFDKKPGTHIRIGFSGHKEEELVSGLRILAALLQNPD